MAASRGRVMTGAGGAAAAHLAAMVLPLLLVGVGVSRSHAQLQVGFYSDSCPDAKDTVTAAVQDAAGNDPTILPELLRLQFHDCFIKGCDASVLIRSTSNDAEVDNAKNQGLCVQDVVDAAKAQLEDQCPGVVSCADILALTARDAVAMVI